MRLARVFIFLIIAGLLAIPMLADISVASAQTAVLQDYYNGAVDDANSTIYANSWGAQTFTTSSTYTMSEIRLLLWREGAPGNVYCELQTIGDTGDPSGSAVSAGILNGNALTTETTGAWYSVDMADYNLEYNTQYAIVVYADYGYSNNTIAWRYDSAAATYAGGQKFTSANGGVTWAAGAGQDFMFEVWGIANIDLLNVKVWENYKEDDDWLITAYYVCSVNPYFEESEPPERWFNLQILNGNCTTGTVVAQSPIRFWGYGPASVYLSADERADLEWGGNITVRLYSTIAENCYVLENEDWRGINLNELDAWVIQVAHSMEIQDGVTYTVGIAESGIVLNGVGGPIFRSGIPQLMDVRGTRLFQEAISEYTRPTPSFSNEMQAESDMEARLGHYTYDAIESVANSFGIEVYILGFVGIALMYLIIAARGVPLGHTGAGMIISLSLLYIGLYTGTFLWLWFSLIAIISAGLFIWHTWLRQT